MLQFMMAMYMVAAAFVLASADRNRREARPNGRAIMMAGEVAFSASASFAVLLLVWVAMHLAGYAPEPVLPA